MVDVSANVCSTPTRASAVTSSSAHVLRVTAPKLRVVVPLIVGRVFHVTVLSDQVVLELVRTVPPAGLPPLLLFATWSRNRALVSVPLTLRRSNRRKLCVVGEPSAISWLVLPDLVVGVDELTNASATGVTVEVAAAAPAPGPDDRNQ